eukprot:288351-Chlamydomonas_euryale.AAC.1
MRAALHPEQPFTIAILHTFRHSNLSGLSITCPSTMAAFHLAGPFAGAAVQLQRPFHPGGPSPVAALPPGRPFTGSDPLFRTALTPWRPLLPDGRST